MARRSEGPARLSGQVVSVSQARVYQLVSLINDTNKLAASVNGGFVLDREKVWGYLCAVRDEPADK